jgi:CRISPR-associated protein Csh1
MLKEIVNFVDNLDAEFKVLGIKPKEGLHILLRIVEAEDGTSEMNDNSLAGWAYTKNKGNSEQDTKFLERCAGLAQVSWCINTNKCFDLPIKAIHSCSPFCLAIKRENLIGGEKYASNAKSQVYDRINAYFSKAIELIGKPQDGQLEIYTKEAEGMTSEVDEVIGAVEVFKSAVNSADKYHSWLDKIKLAKQNKDGKEELEPVLNQMKDGEYVIFYLDIPIEHYERANTNYLTDKLFNTNEHNQLIGGDLYGTSGFFNGFPTKKPFLSHQSASFEIAGRIKATEARSLYEFHDLLGRNIFPRPLPIFIDREELKREAIALFKKDVATGSRMGYQEVIESLYKKHPDELGSYYLLLYQMGAIVDFDFVPKFEYLLEDEVGTAWQVQDLFGIKYMPRIDSVFDFQHLIMVPIFNNALITKTKKGDVQYKYFDEIDPAYCKSANTYLLVMKYRRAFYDFVYKSKRQAITQAMFDDILLTGVLDDLRLDEFKNGGHTQYYSIHQKLNIWFSLSEKFNLKTKPFQTMASKLQAHREFITKLTKGETTIETDDQYAFVVGQVIAYLMSKSKTADTSYQRLEPFLQQVRSKELNKAIARMFDTYKHEDFSKNFRIPFAEVMDFETSTNIRDHIPTILAGIFSRNALFSDGLPTTQDALPENDE